MRRVAAQAAAMAASYVGTQILLEVRPRNVDFGVVLAGQKSTVSVAIAGQFGLPVTGRVASLASWLKVDPASFVGTSSAVRLTADTTRLPQAGRHQTTLEITSGTQKVYIPVTVEVLATQATRAAPPPRAAGAPKAPKPPKASKASGVAARLFRRAPRVPNPPGPKPQAPAATKAPKAARAASARAAPGGKHTVASAATAWTRLLTAWVLVCGLGGWAALELLALAAARVVVLPAWLPLGVALPLAMLLVAPVAAVTGHWGPDTFKRAGTALLCAGAGLGLVLLLAPGWHLDPFAMVALPPWRAATAIAVPLALRPVLLLSLLGVSVGATLGVTPLLSGYLRRVLAFAARHRRALSIVVAVGLGGWAGASLLHWVGSPLPPGVDSFLAFFGAIAGMVATAALAYRANRVLGRLQRTAAHP
jgi:hypothetical protein